MDYLVTGVYCGKKKDGNDNFYVLHLVDIDFKQNGLTGYRVSTAYCTEEVANIVKPNCIYSLSCPIGYRNVNSATFIRENC